MSFREKLSAWFKDPHGLPLALLYLVTAAAAAGAIWITVRGELTFPLNAFAYALYALAAISLGLSVCTLVRVVPKLRQRIVGFLRRYPFTERLLEQYGFRTIVFAVGSLAVSVAYAIFNGVIGIIGSSVWYGSLAAYYLLLALTRGWILFCQRSKKQTENASDEKRRELRAYGISGLVLVVLPIALSFAILQMVRAGDSFEHPGMMIYVAALYAFCKITMSIVNLVRARKNDEMTVRAVRSVNLADAFVSILALQTAMFREFSPGAEVGFANALTGGIVCLLTAALGIFMAASAAARMKKIGKETEDERKE